MSITPQPPAADHVVVSGMCAPEFEPVAAIFARVLAETPGGAAACVYRDGVPVVDLHGGATYGPDSRQFVFSVAKAVSAIARCTTRSYAAVTSRSWRARRWSTSTSPGTSSRWATAAGWAITSCC